MKLSVLLLSTATLALIQPAATWAAQDDTSQRSDFYAQWAEASSSAFSVNQPLFEEPHLAPDGAATYLSSTEEMEALDETITSDLCISGSLGNVRIERQLDVRGSLIVLPGTSIEFTEPVHVAGLIWTYSNLRFAKGCQVEKDCLLTRSSVYAQTLEVGGLLSLGQSSVSTSGDLTGGFILGLGDLECDENLIVAGNAIIDGRIKVGREARSGSLGCSSLDVGGSLQIDQDCCVSSGWLIVGNSAQVGGNLSIGYRGRVANTLEVEGAVMAGFLPDWGKSKASEDLGLVECGKLIQGHVVLGRIQERGDSAVSAYVPN